MYNLKHEIALLVAPALEKLAIPSEVAAIENTILYAPNSELGHFSLPCFALAKLLRKNPNQVATELANELTEGNILGEIKAVGPYVNFFVKNTTFGTQVLEAILSGEYFTAGRAGKPTQDAPRVMVEFSQPNTHKQLHIGHLRNVCLGDALVKLLRYTQLDIISATFPGDVGAHVAKCLWYIRYVNQEPAPEANKGEWLGLMYTNASRYLDTIQGSSEEERVKSQLSEVLTQIEGKAGEFYELWLETRQWSIQQMQTVYDWLAVTFDQWYWESEVDNSSVALIEAYYQKGVFVQSEGVIGADLAAFDLGFCVLIKSDGHGLYATKDIALAIKKFKDFQLAKSIYVVDLRQTHHFKQVFKCLDVMGLPLANDCYHLPYNYVELPSGPMSSRKGNIIPATQLIQQMVATVAADLTGRHGAAWTAADIYETAETIARGAIKYGMLKVGSMQKIVFRMEEWLDLHGNSGPYLQYAVVRIGSLNKKHTLTATTIEWEMLTERAELDLMLHLYKYQYVVASVGQDYDVSQLCKYLFELAQLFNSFYNSFPIIHAPTPELRDARLSLATAVSLVLMHGLALLGIDVPSRM